MLRFAYHKIDRGLYVADFNGTDWKISLFNAYLDKRCEIYTVGDRIFVCDTYTSAANNTYCSTDEVTPAMGFVSVNYTPNARADRPARPIVDSNGIVHSYEYDTMYDKGIVSTITLSSRDKNSSQTWMLPFNIDVRANHPIFIDDRVYLISTCDDQSLCEMVSIIRVAHGRCFMAGCAVGVIDRTILAYDAQANMIHMRDLRMKDPFSCEVAPCVPYGKCFRHEANTSTILHTNAIAIAHTEGVRVIDMRSPAYAYDLPWVPEYNAVHNTHGKFVAY